MTSSGVKGVTSSAVDYIRSALLPEQTNSEATASFTRYVYVKQVLIKQLTAFPQCKFWTRKYPVKLQCFPSVILLCLYREPQPKKTRQAHRPQTPSAETLTPKTKSKSPTPKPEPPLMRKGVKNNPGKNNIAVNFYMVADFGISQVMHCGMLSDMPYLENCLLMKMPI